MSAMPTDELIGCDSGLNACAAQPPHRARASSVANARASSAAGVAAGTASGLFESNPVTMASAALEIDGSTVIPGNGEDSGTQSASAWAKATLDQFKGRGGSASESQMASLIRPTPASARLAYMMLSTMGA